VVGDGVDAMLVDLLVVDEGGVTSEERTLDMLGGVDEDWIAEVVARVLGGVSVLVEVVAVVGSVAVGTLPAGLTGTSAGLLAGRRFLSMRSLISACSARLTIGGARFMPWRALALGALQRNTWAMAIAKRRVKNEGFAILDKEEREKIENCFRV
jgi:hypothetical protein